MKLFKSLTAALLVATLFIAPNAMAEKINVNQADVQMLTQIKGIGEVKAKAIVDYRAQNGAFESVDELDNVKGIGAKTLKKIEDSITLSQLQERQAVQHNSDS